jgi:hypothetical protein
MCRLTALIWNMDKEIRPGSCGARSAVNCGEWQARRKHETIKRNKKTLETIGMSLNKLTDLRLFEHCSCVRWKLSMQLPTGDYLEPNKELPFPSSAKPTTSRISRVPGRRVEEACTGSRLSRLLMGKRKFLRAHCDLSSLEFQMWPAMILRVCASTTSWTNNSENLDLNSVYRHPIITMVA